MTKLVLAVLPSGSVTVTVLVALPVRPKAPAIVMYQCWSMEKKLKL